MYNIQVLTVSPFRCKAYVVSLVELFPYLSHKQLLLLTVAYLICGLEL